jgi:hypothetical protein
MALLPKSSDTNRQTRKMPVSFRLLDGENRSVLMTTGETDPSLAFAPQIGREVPLVQKHP